MDKKKTVQKITSEKSAWREFEALVARIETILSTAGAIVKLRDRIPEIVSGDLREVDASIRTKVGSANILITIECRQRSRSADSTWIEQLKTKKELLGASKTIAVSSNGFSEPAMKKAKQFGIDVRTIKKITDAQIGKWMFELVGFEFQYDLIDYNFNIDVPDSDKDLFNSELEKIKVSFDKIPLWEIPFLKDNALLKKWCLRDIFESVLNRTHQKLIKSIQEKVSDDTFEFNIKLPKGWTYFETNNKKFDLVEYEVKCKLYGYKEQLIKPSSAYKYSDNKKELVNRIEYNYDSPFGIRTAISVNHDLEAGKHVITFENLKDRL